jgi:hypothetical protein
MTSRFGECLVDRNSGLGTEFPLNFKWNIWQLSANPMNLNVTLNAKVRIYAFGVGGGRGGGLLFRLPLKSLLTRMSQSASSQVENKEMLGKRNFCGFSSLETAEMLGHAWTDRICLTRLTEITRGPA